MRNTRYGIGGALLVLSFGMACNSSRGTSLGTGGGSGLGGVTAIGAGAAGGSDSATGSVVVGGIGGSPDSAGGSAGSPEPASAGGIGDQPAGGAGGSPSFAPGGSPAAGGAPAGGGSTAMGGMTGAGGSSSSGGNDAGGAGNIGGGGAAAGGNGGTPVAATGGSAPGGSSPPLGSGGAGGKPGIVEACPTDKEEKFSFFVISNAELIRQGGEDPENPGFSTFGGNLGGIAGADKICQTAAEHVSPCQKNKVWHAFLSTTTQDAIDRVGTGPWYDRNGRLWASTLAALAGDRGSDADPAIRNDIPNENGVNNQDPDGTGKVDNHETLTGSNAMGRLYSQSVTPGSTRSVSCGLDVGATEPAQWSPERATCWNWTRKTPEGCPRVGHSWCTAASCLPVGSGSGTNWISVSNEGGCAPGGTLVQMRPPTDIRKVGAAGGYGGFYCLAVIPHP